MQEARIVVVGSINMDLVTEAPRLPHLGETVLGTRFTTVPGGKGANQAVACARLGPDVIMIGCVGNDAFGKQATDNLYEQNVITDYVETVSGVSTGIASISIEDGENSIVVVPGANYHLTPDKIKFLEPVIKEADLVLLQLEIPVDTVQITVNLAAKHDVPVILNPAPAINLPQKMLEKVSVLTPNEHELAIVLGHNPEVADFQELMNRHPGTIVMTKGSEGAYYTQDDRSIGHIPSYNVEAVDTTGAGDSFNAGLAVMLSKGHHLRDAVRYAAAVGALSVTKFGAQGGMPTKKEVEAFIRQQS